MNLERMGTPRAHGLRHLLDGMMRDAFHERREDFEESLILPLTWPEWLPILDTHEDAFEGGRRIGDMCWVVWEAEWGGQIVATCPLDIILGMDRVPRHSAASAARRLLELAWRITREDGCSCYGVVVRADSQDFFVPPTRLPGWEAVKGVCGGMGGGVLLQNDLWLHSHMLALGPETVNRFRRLVGLPSISLDGIVWDEDDLAHANTCRGAYTTAG